MTMAYVEADEWRNAVESFIQARRILWGSASANYACNDVHRLLEPLAKLLRQSCEKWATYQEGEKPWREAYYEEQARIAAAVSVIKLDDPALRVLLKSKR